MMKLALSRAATALIRALAARSGLPRDRIFLIEARSTDWQSLTFKGERHEVVLRLPPPFAAEALSALADGLSEHQFDLPGHLVVDVALDGEPVHEPDGAIRVSIEALTLVADD